MKRSIHRNSFAEGAILGYIAIVLTKLLGALYSIPFYQLIGDRGGFIYSCAYNVYALFLEISTSGIPIALSILIGEYIALGQFASKEKAFRIARTSIGAISVAAFLIMELFAGAIAGFFIQDMAGGATPAEVTLAIRVVAVSPLIVPFLSTERGYMQGHKFISVASNSQLIEQAVRIAVVLLGAWLSIRVLGLGLMTGLSVALFGAAVGGAVSFIYVYVRHHANEAEFLQGVEETLETADPTRQIIRKLAGYCIVVIIISITTSVYNLIDMKLILVGLHHIGYSDADTQTIASINSTWIPKICNIITALTLGMIGSIAPHIADDYARGDKDGIASKLNQALELILFLAVPIALGVIILADSTYTLFYGVNPYGGNILRLALILNILASFVGVLSMALQSMKKGKAVSLALIAGVILNLTLDLPLIYLFDRIGLEPYLGATVASIIGQTVTLALYLRVLRKDIRIDFRHALATGQKLVVPLLVMAAAVFAIRHFWPDIPDRSVRLLLQVLVHGVTGAALYFGICYKTGIFTMIFGEHNGKILSRFMGK